MAEEHYLEPRRWKLEQASAPPSPAGFRRMMLNLGTADRPSSEAPGSRTARVRVCRLNPAARSRRGRARPPAAVRELGGGGVGGPEGADGRRAQVRRRFRSFHTPPAGLRHHGPGVTPSGPAPPLARRRPSRLAPSAAPLPWGITSCPRRPPSRPAPSRRCSSGCGRTWRTATASPWRPGGRGGGRAERQCRRRRVVYGACLHMFHV